MKFLERKSGISRSRLLLLPCFAGMALAVFLLRADFVSPHGKARGTTVGTITQCTSEVRRKPAASFLWSNAAPGTPLFADDSIQTGPGGGAEIRRIDGTVIQLGEETMVVLEENISEAKVVSRKKAGVVHWSKGAASSEQQMEMALAQHEASADALGLKSPLFDQFFISSPTPFLFSWDHDDATYTIGNRYVVEVATDVAFTKLAAAATTLDQTFSSDELGLTPGKYFWRVRVVDSRGRTVKSSKVIKFAYALSPLLKTAPEKIEPLDASNRGRLPSSTP